MQQNSFQVSMKKFLRINFCFCDVIRDRNGERNCCAFYEKEFQGTSQAEFRVKKVIKRKEDKLYGNAITILLIVESIKNAVYECIFS